MAFLLSCGPAITQPLKLGKKKKIHLAFSVFPVVGLLSSVMFTSLGSMRGAFPNSLYFLALQIFVDITLSSW